MKNQMNGAWALVTGASSGIGQEFAIKLASLGMNIILVARREQKLKILKDELEKKFSVRALIIQADLSKLDSSAKVFEQAIADGREIQVLINNAGRGQYGPHLKFTQSDHIDTINLNITSLTQLTHLFLEHMLEHKKKSYISSIASTASYVTAPYFGVYSGSKKYVKDFSLCLYDEYKNSNVHFCCISPGGTYTEFMDNAGQELTKRGHASMMSAEKVASIGLDAMFENRPLVVTGWLNKILTLLPRILPELLMFNIAGHALKASVEQKKISAVNTSIER